MALKKIMWLALWAGIASLSACGGGGGGGGGSSSGGSAVAIAAEVKASLTMPTGQVPSGAQATLTLDVSNTGNGAASAVNLSTTLPSTLSLVGISCKASGAAVCPSSLSGLNLSLGNLPAGGALSLGLNVSVAGGTSGEVKVSVNLAPAGVASSTVSATLQAFAADVGVTASGAGADVIVGGTTASYGFVVSNAGPDAARDVSLSLVPDTGLTPGAVACAATAGATCPGTLTGTIKLSELPKGGSLTFTLPVQVGSAAQGNVGVAASVQAAGDTTVANNSASSKARTVARNSVTLTSDAGDFIGDGRSYSYDQSNSLLDFRNHKAWVGVYVTGEQSWSGDFYLPAGNQQLTTGSFTGLKSLGFGTEASGMLSWSGESRACNQSDGTMNISRAVYAAGQLQELDFSFVQHCERGAPALRGVVHWTIYDKSTLPGPVLPVPNGVWAPDASKLPASGNYAYIDSPPGERVVGGRTSLLQASAGDFIFAYNNAKTELSIGVAGFSGIFKAMPGQASLQPGYYGGLQQYPGYHPLKGALNWYSNQRICPALQSGWFVIDAITYDGDKVKAVELRFEQHCEGDPAPLRGKIRWSS